MQTKTLITVEGGKVWATQQQADTIQALSETRKGGFARVYGYKPSTGYEISPVQDIVMVTRFNVAKLYQRKIKALHEIEFKDIKASITKTSKLAALNDADLEALFVERKQMLVDSMKKTLTGDRDDAHRQGHDRCYLHIAEGIKVNYVTEKGKDGLMHPVLTDGFPTVASIMVTYLENSKVTREEGKYKAVNSGNPVLMTNIIEAQLNSKSVGLKMLSLKEDNFERLVIDNEVVLREDVAGLV